MFKMSVILNLSALARKM